MSALDIIFILAVFFALAVIIIITNVAMSPMMVALNASYGTNTTGVSNINDKFIAMWNSTDIMLALIFFGLILGMFISAYFIYTHPVFFIAYLIVGILAIFFAPFIANIFGVIISDPSISATASSYPYTIYIFQNFPLFMAIAFILGLIATMAKPPELQGY